MMKLLMRRYQLIILCGDFSLVNFIKLIIKVLLSSYFIDRRLIITVPKILNHKALCNAHLSILWCLTILHPLSLFIFLIIWI